MSTELSFSPLGKRLIAPGVTHFLQRAGTDTVAGAVCSAAAIAAGEALDATASCPLPGPEGVDQNPYTRRRAELTPTSILRALRPASAHYLIALFEDANDRTLLGSLMGIAADEVVSRLFVIHAEVFELGRESQHAIADYWSRLNDPQRYSLGMWGLATAATFGVRHLDESAARAFREHLDAALPEFGRRLATELKALVQEGRELVPIRGQSLA